MQSFAGLAAAILRYLISTVAWTIADCFILVPERCTTNSKPSLLTRCFRIRVEQQRAWLFHVASRRCSISHLLIFTRCITSYEPRYVVYTVDFFKTCHRRTRHDPCNQNHDHEEPFIAEGTCSEVEITGTADGRCLCSESTSSSRARMRSFASSRNFSCASRLWARWRP